jgi:hypothetical protein
LINQLLVLITQANIGGIAAQPWSRNSETPSRVYDTLAPHMTKGVAKRIK